LEIETFPFSEVGLVVVVETFPFSEEIGLVVVERLPFSEEFGLEEVVFPFSVEVRFELKISEFPNSGFDPRFPFSVVAS
jgi:hypothetical protein